MSEFTWEADQNATADRQPRVKSLRFGDGYEQRQADGINTQPEIWSLTFSNRDVEDIDDIDEFLTDAAGVDYFEWTPPGSSTEGNYICRRWQRQYVNAALASITATFEEVFDDN